MYFFIIFPEAKGEFVSPHAREQLRSLESNETGTTSAAEFIDSGLYLAEESKAEEIVTLIIPSLSSFYTATEEMFF